MVSAPLLECNLVQKSAWFFEKPEAGSSTGQLDHLLQVHVLAAQSTALSDCALCALQYGGSEAHSTFFQRQRGDWEAATQSRDFLTSIRRFYSNTYTDSEKQVGCKGARHLALAYQKQLQEFKTYLCVVLSLSCVVCTLQAAINLFLGNFGAIHGHSLQV